MMVIRHYHKNLLRNGNTFKNRVMCINESIITLIKVHGCALLGWVLILSNDWLWFIAFMI